MKIVLAGENKFFEIILNFENLEFFISEIILGLKIQYAYCYFYS